MADIKELFSLKDRVAIVTGGGQGLGKSMAIGLAQAGANIVIAARRIESAMETKKEIEAIGVKCTVIIVFYFINLTSGITYITVVLFCVFNTKA